MLDRNGNNTWDGTTVYGFYFWSTGQAGEVPVYGDWNGDGTTKMGIFLNGYWVLDYNGNGIWDGPSVDKAYSFGVASDIPVVGDWNGDGRTKIGVYSGSTGSTPTFLIDYTGDGVWELVVDKSMVMSIPGYTGAKPVIGDWNGNGYDKIGVYAGGAWALDLNGNYTWDNPNLPNGDKVVQ